MFDNNIQRMGFCCKYMDPNQDQKPKVLKEIQQNYTEKSTTRLWCNNNPDKAEQKLFECVEHNMQSAYNLVEYVGNLAPERRMVRLGSNQIPMATEPTWRYVWQDKNNRDWMAKGFAKVGELARELDVRLSFHPGQFCVLASDNDDIVERSIDEFEYHVDMIRWMGFGQTFQDFKCNVHISGKRGYQGIIDILPRLTPEARNTITIENDETKHGLDASLMLVDHVPLVLDLHHHWIRDEEYIRPDDDRVKRVIDSWRGVRPALHYSYSRDHGLQMSDLHKDNINHSGLHDIGQLLETGAKKAKLRAHSDMYPNPDVNAWALSFWQNFDIQCEAKHKNLATEQLHLQAVQSINNTKQGHTHGSPTRDHTRHAC